MAVFDDRTTETCLARNGLVWMFDQAGNLQPDGHSVRFEPVPLHVNCLQGQSLVTTPQGLKRIDRVAVGDLVLTHRGRWRSVYAVMSRPNQEGIVRALHTETGRVLRVTDEHPIITASAGWKRAADIQVGDQLFEDGEQGPGEELPSVVVGTTDNYPPIEHEGRVFDRFTGFPAGMTSAVHLKSNTVGKHEVDDAVAHDELMFKRNPSTDQQSGDEISTGQVRTHFNLSRVTKIEIEPYAGRVFNLSVEEDETFVAESIVVSNCRSTLTPVLKSWKELGFEYDEEAARNVVVDDPDILSKPFVKASMDGEIPEALSMDDWLRGKPREFVEEQLGKGKADLFLSGTIDLADLLDDNGNVRTLTDLKRRFA